MKDLTTVVSKAARPVDNVHQVGANAVATLPARAPRKALPMPGRLPVAYFDRPTRQVVTDAALNTVATGTLVTTGGTITAVHRLPGNRAMVVIQSDDGHSAHVLLDAHVTSLVSPSLYRGYRLDVRGTVTRSTGTQLAGIDAHAVLVGIL